MKRKATEEFKKEIDKLTNSEYEIKTEYINNSTKILFFHKECQQYFFMTPNKFLSGHRCPNCSKMRVKSFDEMQAMIHLVNPEMTLLSNYTYSTKPALIRHEICGRSFFLKPSEIINNNKKCPFCYNKINGEAERLQLKLDEKFGNIILISKYQNTGFLDFYCKSCQTKFSSRVNNILKLNSCPICQNKPILNIISKYITLEKEINYEVFSSCLLLFNFYVPEVNLLIDYYDPVYYDQIKEIKLENKPRFKEKMKKDYCKNNRIKYLEIPFWEAEKIPELLNELMNKKMSYSGFIKWLRRKKLKSFTEWKKENKQ